MTGIEKGAISIDPSNDSATRRLKVNGRREGWVLALSHVVASVVLDTAVVGKECGNGICRGSRS